MAPRAGRRVVRACAVHDLGTERHMDDGTINNAVEVSVEMVEMVKRCGDVPKFGGYHQRLEGGCI